MKSRLSVFGLLTFVACRPDGAANARPTSSQETTGGPSGSANATSSPSVQDFGFPPLPGLRYLCGGRDYPPPSADGGFKHISWEAFESAEAPGAVVAHYRARLPAAAFEADDAGGRFRMPGEGETPVLGVLAVSSHGPHSTCETKPSSRAQTILIVSRR
jgi:hypothetical protein